MGQTHFDLLAFYQHNDKYSTKFDCKSVDFVPGIRTQDHWKHVSLPIPTYLCLSTYVLMSIYLRLPTYVYLLTSTYLPTYLPTYP